MALQVAPRANAQVDREGGGVSDWEGFLFLAFATIFGLAMLTVGWQLRAMAQEDARKRLDDLRFFTSQNSGV